MTENKAYSRNRQPWFATEPQTSSIRVLRNGRAELLSAPIHTSSNTAHYIYLYHNLRLWLVHMEIFVQGSLSSLESNIVERLWQQRCPADTLLVAADISHSL